VIPPCQSTINLAKRIRRWRQFGLKRDSYHYRIVAFSRAIVMFDDKKEKHYSPLSIDLHRVKNQFWNIKQYITGKIKYPQHHSQ